MMTQFEQRVLALIDEMVEHGTDDELFAGGYLRGHLTLAVADAEADGVSSLSELAQRVNASLDAAIAKGELSPPDQVLVRNLWQQLYQQAAA
ncbi:YfcL family protein [Plesiomonas shigelloides]|uniref:YfcL family protein n=1 Tax=Plesiomonas shigelloides TaxID=703 RepID=UPI00057B4717|nr:YfcL family protein [Plesiomonas shigelloides]KAB7659721.1 YfcL family protein [Plesiomonas shigelloides]KAB7666591.1 YfcL family protein [Plesiomonas shigelloides]KAB7697361.1 YfcL family protein [Plesiomonas shigelloides]QIY09789.1 YfcL family protein [Plesiomonas shigelloides]QWK95234.1 YfcL family protein [Plesiomonas shigelloides]